MSALVVDTSIWIDYFAGRPQPDLEQALQQARVHVPPIVISELLSGNLSRRDLAELVDLFGTLPVCETPFEHWVRVGRLRSSLGTKGLTISTPDAHVAQCCMDLEGQLLTRDRVFEQIARKCPLQLAG